MTRSRLPLRGISVFEAVTRLGSFKAAAAELHLTPSAVSHQIRALEEELGVSLFQRMGRGVKPSADAADYAKSLHGVFDRLHHATDQIAARSRNRDVAGIVRIMTPPSLATHWLMPRLPGFIAAHPGVDMRVLAIRTADDSASEVDITIRYGDSARWGGQARPLLQETIQPYCAPALLDGEAAITPEQLLRLPLIRSRDNDVSWESWFGERGLTLDTPGVPPIQIDPSYVAIEAAVKGIGVILESSILTHEHVDMRRLVAPVHDRAAALTSYWLLPLRRGTKPAAAIAYEWLVGQANI